MDPRRRMMLYRTMHQWHWISAGICLAALLLFSITGITLNHSSAISAQPRVSKHEARLPESLRGQLAGALNRQCIVRGAQQVARAFERGDVARARGERAVGVFAETRVALELGDEQVEAFAAARR